MRTLLLDRTGWDLVIDVYGDIAVAGDPYSQAQDAASAIKTFRGEQWYDTTEGVQYWDNVLGKFPPLSLVKAAAVNAAKTVPGVASAVCFISSFEKRVLAGQVQITNESGQTQAASF